MVEHWNMSWAAAADYVVVFAATLMLFICCFDAASSTFRNLVAAFGITEILHSFQYLPHQPENGYSSASDMTAKLSQSNQSINCTWHMIS